MTYDYETIKADYLNLARIASGYQRTNVLSSGYSFKQVNSGSYIRV